jgi:hypothetical protein
MHTANSASAFSSMTLRLNHDKATFIGTLATFNAALVTQCSTTSLRISCRACYGPGLIRCKMGGLCHRSGRDVGERAAGFRHASLSGISEGGGHRCSNLKTA